MYKTMYDEGSSIYGQPWGRGDTCYKRVFSIFVQYIIYNIKIIVNLVEDQ